MHWEPCQPVQTYTSFLSIRLDGLNKTTGNVVEAVVCQVPVKDSDRVTNVPKVIVTFEGLQLLLHILDAPNFNLRPRLGVFTVFLSPLSPRASTRVVLRFLDRITVLRRHALSANQLVRGYIQKVSNWPPGARTANGTAFCH
jgi:hypothetical protein